MLKKEREREIIEQLKSNNGFVTVKELCDKLFASESSIRRDLSSLESMGLIYRTYGGAELITNFSNVISFDKRSQHSIDAKKVIAKKAAALIKDGDIIFLDQSSTAFFLANEIINNHTLTVVTNNIAILSLLTKSQMKVIASGGIMSKENHTCLIGTDAEYIFDNTYADIMFFSAKSLSYDGVISDCTREEICVRNSMLKNAKQKVFLCDGEKFGTRSPYKQCTLSDIDFLVSDKENFDDFTQIPQKLKLQ